jgi:hypothetical protein
LKDHERDSLRKLYENHVNSTKYVLTKDQRTRMLGLSKKERYSKDSDFWYHVKHQARKGLMDLELIASIANDDQLGEIFEPYDRDDNIRLDLLFGARKRQDFHSLDPSIKGEYLRTDLKRIVSKLLTRNENAPSASEQWKYRLAVDMVNVGLDYISQRSEFKTTLHRRLFQDLRDSIGTNYWQQ